MYLWMTPKQTIKKLNLWGKMAVDKSAWIKACIIGMPRSCVRKSCMANRVRDIVNSNKNVEDSNSNHGQQKAIGSFHTKCHSKIPHQCKLSEVWA